MDREGVLRGKEATDTLCEPLQRLDVEGVRSAEGVDHLRLGATGLGVPHVVGELDVGHLRAVLVRPGDGTHIHV